METRRDFLKTSLAAAVVAARPALCQSDDPTALTLRKAADMVRQKTVSPVELTRACLSRIERLNPVVNAFITVTGEQALADARALEAEARNGKWRGPLHGVPIALKDNIDTAGIRTTGASALFADRIPTEDAEVVRRLKAAGAILLGKLNLHEFAAGGTTVVTYFGAAKNPWKREFSTGGSSGGSGAAVAAQFCYGALGTDTGGSIRIPAAYCGIVGLKPTYGRVSNRGVIPLSWSLDHVGPMCRTVGDAAVMLQVLAGYDPADTSTVDVPVPDYVAALDTKTAGFRLGIPRALFFDKLDPDIAKAAAKAIDVLRKLTAGAHDVALPAVADLPSVVGPETYAYHAQHFSRTPTLYQPATRKRLERGRDVPSATYAQARRDLDRVRREVRSVFADVDLLVTPTMKIPPYTIEEALKRDNEEIPPMVLLSNTGPFNLFGLPTISVPCGFTEKGLPIGLQISGAPFAEAKVLALAHAYEQATDWHTKHPDLT
jgi:aspartyl-tRNA(Asn)/glutamyl-tRNA(Gln) amidotransferase subunit A